MLRGKLILLVIIAPIIFSTVAKAVFISYLSSKSGELLFLERKERTLVKENLKLKKELAKISSLSSIKERALSKGFVVLNLEFLEVPSLASR